MTGVALSSLTFWLVFKLSFFYLDIGPMNHKDLYVREISRAQTCIFGFVCPLGQQNIVIVQSLMKLQWTDFKLSFSYVFCLRYPGTTLVHGRTFSYIHVYSFIELKHL